MDPADGARTVFTDEATGARNVTPGANGVYIACQTNGVIYSESMASALSRIDAMAKADDASGLRPALLTAAGATGALPGWLGVDRATVAGAPAVATLDTLQFMVDTVNALEALGALNK
jgi:hypothetical protein